MRIGLIGTRGVPARYGGFETLIEEVGSRLADRGHGVTVYCRPVEGEPALDSYRGMQLVELPIIRRRSMETLAHTALSVFHKSLSAIDAALLFNAANAPLLPVIRARRKPVATHVDGLEWMRGKWGPTGKQYYRIAESLAVRWSNALIADAAAIQDYYLETFGAESHLIAYGAPIIEDVDSALLADIGLEPLSYHLVVARFEPENHVLEIVSGYAASDCRLPLLVVGSAPYSDLYTEAIRAAADDRVNLIGSVWDQSLLNALYANCASYIHGHSVGGTNPSLLRAAGAGAYTIAFDVDFNREVVGGLGAYFSTPAELARRLEHVESHLCETAMSGARLRKDIARYNWDDVAIKYEQLAIALASGRLRGRLGSGRRRE